MDTKRQSPSETLAAGAEILRDFLASHGFVYAPTGSGKGSGGSFASGEFRRANRRIELHFRYSLGLVTCHVGRTSFSHDDYMWSMLGRRWASKYPGVSDDALEAFRDLLHDLKQHGQDFLEGTDSDFLRRVDHAKTLKTKVPHLP